MLTLLPVNDMSFTEYSVDVGEINLYNFPISTKGSYKKKGSKIHRARFYCQGDFYNKCSVVRSDFVLKLRYAICHQVCLTVKTDFLLPVWV